MAKKRRNGSGNMIDRGMRPMMLYFTPEEMELLEAAAAKDFRTRANFAKAAIVFAISRLLGPDLVAKAFAKVRALTPRSPNKGEESAQDGPGGTVAGL